MTFVAAAFVTAGASLIGSSMQADAAQSAAQTQAQAEQNAINAQQQQFNQIQQQEAPYRAEGYNALNTLGSMMNGAQPVYNAQGTQTGTQEGTGYLTQQFGPAQLQSSLSPNYQFMLNQGLQANTQGMNAMGGGSNIARSNTAFAQNYASNAYQNAYNNFTNQQTNIYNRLAGIAGIGQTGQSAVNNAGMAAAGNIGQAQVGMGTALAAGQVGAANAYANGLNGVGNSAMLYSLLSNNAQNTGAAPGTIALANGSSDPLSTLIQSNAGNWGINTSGLSSE